jgi:GAF domain-containing protein
VDRERRLVASLVELADIRGTGHDTLEFLHMLSDHAVELLDVSAAGVLLSPENKKLGLVGASCERMRVLGLFEAQRHQGPGHEAYVSGEAVHEPDLAACADRWPEFVERALDMGYRNVAAQPIAAHDQRLGALAVFRAAPGPFDDADRTVLAGLARMAALGLVNQRALASADEQIAQLKAARESSAVLEQAKALLADRTGVDHGTAFHRLRRYARDHNKKLRDVARRYVDGDLDESALPVDA